MQAHHIHDFSQGMKIVHVIKYLIAAEFEPAMEKSDKSDKNMPGKTTGGTTSA